MTLDALLRASTVVAEIAALRMVTGSLQRLFEQTEETLYAQEGYANAG
jgi:hypothetical protein